MKGLLMKVRSSHNKVPSRPMIGWLKDVPQVGGRLEFTLPKHPLEPTADFLLSSVIQEIGRTQGCWLIRTMTSTYVFEEME